MPPARRYSGKNTHLGNRKQKGSYCEHTLVWDQKPQKWCHQDPHKSPLPRLMGHVACFQGASHCICSLNATLAFCSWERGSVRTRPQSGTDWTVVGGTTRNAAAGAGCLVPALHSKCQPVCVSKGRQGCGIGRGHFLWQFP